MQQNNLKGTLILTLTALIWGLAFVAQSDASAVPPFLINCLRSVISVGFLSIVYIIINRKEKKPFFPKERPERKISLAAGLICGITFTVAANLQQVGISLYPKDAAVEAHSGFITALYVVMVPIIALLMRKKISPVTWVAVLLALAGFYMLCLYTGFGSLYTADLIILLCALAFSLQIMAIDIFVSAVGSIRLSLMQFAFGAVASGILSAVFERDRIDWGTVLQYALPILYLGIMSSGVAYTLQIVGQKYAEPAVASITMSLESVFAALGGFIISKRTLTVHEIIGCVLVFAAIITAQLPDILRSRKRNT